MRKNRRKRKRSPSLIQTQNEEQKPPSKKLKTSETNSKEIQTFENIENRDGCFMNINQPPVLSCSSVEEILASPFIPDLDFARMEAEKQRRFEAEKQRTLRLEAEKQKNIEIRS